MAIYFPLWLNVRRNNNGILRSMPILRSDLQYYLLVPGKWKVHQAIIFEITKTAQYSQLLTKMPAQSRTL